MKFSFPWKLTMCRCGTVNWIMSADDLDPSFARASAGMPLILATWAILESVRTGLMFEKSTLVAIYVWKKNLHSILQIRTGVQQAYTVYPKKYAHGFCFAVLCCGYTLTDFPISIRLTSLALWQSNDCPSASKATLMNMDKYFMWIHYKRLHNHNKAKHNKTVCIFLGIYCIEGMD